MPDPQSPLLEQLALLALTDMRTLRSGGETPLAFLDQRKLRCLGRHPAHPAKSTGGLPSRIADLPSSLSPDPTLFTPIKVSQAPSCNLSAATDISSSTSIPTKDSDRDRDADKESDTSVDNFILLDTPKQLVSRRLRSGTERGAQIDEPDKKDTTCGELTKDSLGRYKKPSGEAGRVDSKRGWNLVKVLEKCDVSNVKGTRKQVHDVIALYLDHGLSYANQDTTRRDRVTELLKARFPELASDFVDAWPVTEIMRVRLKSTSASKAGVPQASGYPGVLPIEKKNRMKKA